VLRQLTRLGSQDSITLVFGVRNVSPPSVNRGSHAPDEEDCTLQATTDTKKPTIKTAAGTKGAILAAMITEAERGSLAGRLQTLRFGSKGATIAFVTDGSPLDARLSTLDSRLCPLGFQSPKSLRTASRASLTRALSRLAFIRFNRSMAISWTLGLMLNVSTGVFSSET